MSNRYTISVKKSTKEKFDERKPDELTQEEFMNSLLITLDEAYEMDKEIERLKEEK